jgi:hypothetical protein
VRGSGNTADDVNRAVGENDREFDNLCVSENDFVGVKFGDATKWGVTIAEDVNDWVAEKVVDGSNF